jgi:hypothetical protein
MPHDVTVRSIDGSNEVAETARMKGTGPICKFVTNDEVSGPDDVFPHLAAITPVSHTAAGARMSLRFCAPH